MNLAYFRKSSFDRATSVANVRKEAEALKLMVLGETVLPSGTGTVVHVHSPVWMGNLVAADRNLVGLLPGAVLVVERDGGVFVGMGSAAVLGGVSRDPAVADVAAKADAALKRLIENAAGVEALKPTGVRVYSTKTCPYCKMEAAWLGDKNVTFETTYVDEDQKAAERMVAATGQMGVPVTEVTFTDSEPEYVVGFDKGKLAALLGVAV